MDNIDNGGIRPEEAAPRKSRFRTKYAKIGFIAFLVVAGSILFYFSFFKDRTLFAFIGKIMDKLTPFAIGAVLAYLLKPICQVFEKWTASWFSRMKNAKKAAKLSQNVSIFFTILVFLLLIYVFINAVIPQVADSIKVLVTTMPGNFEKASDWLIKVTKDTFLEETVNDFTVNGMVKIEEWLNKLLTNDWNKLLSGLTVGVKSVFSVLYNVLIGFVACVYILGQRRKLAAQGKMLVYSIFNDKWAEKVMDEVQYVDKMFSGFINGKIIDSIIIGLLTFCVTSIFRIPYAMLISVIVGITNIIPFFGPWIGAIPSAFIVLMVSPVKCLYFIIIIIVIQQLDGNIIGPKILGNTTGLSSFWVLFSIVFFGGMFGFMGMLLGVPLFAVLYDIVKRLVKHGLSKHDHSELFIEYEDRVRLEEEEKKRDKKHLRNPFKKIHFRRKKR